jgi:hypothetical protein
MTRESPRFGAEAGRGTADEPEAVSRATYHAHPSAQRGFKSRPGHFYSLFSASERSLGLAKPSRFRGGHQMAKIHLAGTQADPSDLRSTLDLI